MRTLVCIVRQRIIDLWSQRRWQIESLRYHRLQIYAAN